MALQSGIEVTKVSTSPEMPLGFIFEEIDPDNQDRGIRKWRYIRMTGSAGAAGDVVARPPAGTDWSACVLAASASHTRQDVAGVLQHAIAQNSYGFVQISGYAANIATDGGVVAGDVLVIHTVGGQTDTFTAGEENIIVGKAQATDTGNLTAAWLDLPLV